METELGKNQGTGGLLLFGRFRAGRSLQCFAQNDRGPELRRYHCRKSETAGAEPGERKDHLMGKSGRNQFVAQFFVDYYAEEEHDQKHRGDLGRDALFGT